MVITPRRACRLDHKCEKIYGHQNDQSLCTKSRVYYVLQIICAFVISRFRSMYSKKIVESMLRPVIPWEQVAEIGR